MLKYHLTIYLCFSALCTLYAQAPSVNYVKETTVLVPGMRQESAVTSLPSGEKSVNITYVDGLGRPVQKVSWQASPGKKDLVQPIIYDAFGREPVKYLPYVSTENNGSYKINPVGTPGNSSTYTTSPHFLFYNMPNDKVENDENPYAKTVFEPSPLNTVVKQGAPGSVWQPDANNPNDKTVKLRYELNLANEVFRFTYDDATGGISLSGSRFYSPGQLSITVTTDEQGHEAMEYKDKEDKVILKKVEYGSEGNTKLYACTYYIYNDLGDLTVVLPPEAIKILIDCKNPNNH
jgi:hypothetical protein